ncbi:MAG: hypothetical protein HDR19_01900 [Lachnospiraceae bacterium]|nr:hypothetical protein [Lachnospiraceae bacterium]
MSTKAKTVPGFTLSTFVAPKEDWYKNLNLQDSIDMAKEKMVAAAENFVAVGYYLKHIRDGELYKNKGYKNIWECAEHELKLSQSTASRYISICEKFSRDGNSPYLDEKFKEYGKSQLQEMLTISDQKLIEQVTPDMPVKQIQKLKKDNHIAEKNNTIQTEQPEDEDDAYTALPGQMEIVLDGTFRELEPDPETSENADDSMEQPTNQIFDADEFVQDQKNGKSDTDIQEKPLVDEVVKFAGEYDISLIDKLIAKYEDYREYSIKADVICEYNCLLDALALLKQRMEGSKDE